MAWWLCCVLVVATSPYNVIKEIYEHRLPNQTRESLESSATKAVAKVLTEDFPDPSTSFAYPKVAKAMTDVPDDVRTELTADAVIRGVKHAAVESLIGDVRKDIPRIVKLANEQAAKIAGAKAAKVAPHVAHKAVRKAVETTCHEAVQALVQFAKKEVAHILKHDKFPTAKIDLISSPDEIEICVLDGQGYQSFVEKHAVSAALKAASTPGELDVLASEKQQVKKELGLLRTYYRSWLGPHIARAVEKSLGQREVSLSQTRSKVRGSIAAAAKQRCEREQGALDNLICNTAVRAAWNALNTLSMYSSR